jgi:hypothetical protein
MTVLIKIFDEPTNTNKDIKLENVTDVSINETCESYIITYDSGRKMKYIPCMRVLEMDVIDSHIKSISLVTAGGVS